ncbi:MAG: putative porin [Leptospirales bacterium]|nr:putative porin [Leptospirales bacterium]
MAQTTSGDLIFETGSRSPDFSGFRGGSRLTYPRNLVQPGLGLRWGVGAWELGAQLQGTGWRQHPGRARNEDFTLQPESTIRRNGFDSSNWSYRDSAYVISAGRNFADAHGRSSMTEYGAGLRVRWFPFDDQSREGLFAEAQLQYRYNKQYIYDAWQFIGAGNVIFYSPIGSGNTLTNVIWEYPLGPGYRFSSGPWRFETALLINNGFNRGRDFHLQRAITFHIKNGAGDGGILRGAIGYKIDESYRLEFVMEARRYFSTGELSSTGGLGSEAVLVAVAGPQRVWLSEKEFRTNLSLWARID